MTRPCLLIGMVLVTTLTVAGCPESAVLSDSSESTQTASNAATNQSANADDASRQSSDAVLTDAGDSTTRSNEPTVTAPADLTVECDGDGNPDALARWLAAATFTDGCGATQLTNDFDAIRFACGTTGAVTVTWTATDRCGQTATDSATFTIVDTTAPDLSVPTAFSTTCGDPAEGLTLQQWLASARASDDCGDVTISTERSARPGDCTATITWTATDDCGNTTSDSSTYTTVGDTTPPTIALNGDAEYTIECGDAWRDPGVTVQDDCDALIEPTITGEFDSHTPGVYVLSYAAVDACGNAAPTLSRTVTVEDTTPPVVHVNRPKQLWPPNHKMETLTLADLVTIEDACEGELRPNEVGTILDIYSDEPDNDTGDGNTTGDIEITDDHTFAVRAERKGNGNGRVYGVHFIVTDAAGNTTEATAYMTVPHNESGDAATDDGSTNGQVVKW